MTTKRSYWRWGYEEVSLPAHILNKYKTLIQGAFQVKKFDPIRPRPLDELQLRTPRFSLPASLEKFSSSTPYDRASHSYGKAFRDVWRGLQGIFPNPFMPNSIPLYLEKYWQPPKSV